jgi:hypothetical protein
VREVERMVQWDVEYLAVWTDEATHALNNTNDGDVYLQSEEEKGRKEWK